MGEKLMCWIAAVAGILAGGLFFSAIVDGFQILQSLKEL